MLDRPAAVPTGAAAVRMPVDSLRRPVTPEHSDADFCNESTAMSSQPGRFAYVHHWPIQLFGLLLSGRPESPSASTDDPATLNRRYT